LEDSATLRSDMSANRDPLPGQRGRPSNRHSLLFLMGWQWGESDKPVFLAIVETLPESEGLADQFDNVGVMGQAIEEGCG
jgi:hypothetical protein